MRTAGEPPDEAIDALNEDLSRILLGESPSLLLRRGTAVAGDLRREALFLLKELAQAVRKLEWKTEAGRREARRTREITAALLDLLDPPTTGRAAVLEIPLSSRSPQAGLSISSLRPDHPFKYHRPAGR
jgi:hypothetical protein